jgi:phage gp36-like protein
MTKTVEINNVIYYVYADLQDAEIYNNAIVGSSWSTLDKTTKSQYLVMATRKIDSYQYAGSKLSETQPLKFPRISQSGKVSSDQVLIDLCCQISAYYLTNGTSSGGGDSGNILSQLDNYQIGDLKIGFKSDAQIDLSGLDDFIEQALKDWLMSQSMEIWL